MNNLNKPLAVAVGVILRSSENKSEPEVCISLRPKHLHKGGLWEFPGGKIEEGETAASALKREIKEELGIEISDAKPMIDIQWDYPEKTVLLNVMKVTVFEGEATGLEGQQVKWIKTSELADYNFPEANQEIIEALLAAK